MYFVVRKRNRKQEPTVTNLVSPVCFCLVSSYAIFTIQKQFLTHVHGDIIKGVQAETLVRLE